MERFSDKATGLIPLAIAPLVLLYLDGNDHATTAEVLGLSVSNVSTKLARIKDRLRVALTGGAPLRPTETRHAAR